MSETGDAPSDLLRERVDQSQLKLWLQLEADRWLVTGMLVVIVFGTLVGVGYLFPTAENAIWTSDSVDTLFQGLLTATITGVTLILTLNQLVLSQELGAVKDQHERMEGAMEFRRDVESTIQAPVSPSRPAQFLRALVQVSGERAEKLREEVPESVNEKFSTEIDDFTKTLIEDTERVAEGFDDARFGSFNVLSSALNFNYSWKIFTARHIKERYGDLLTDQGTAAIEELIEVLQLYGPAREQSRHCIFSGN